MSVAPSRDDLCLDFVNTRYWRGSEPATETLNTPDDLAAWWLAQGGTRAEALLAPAVFTGVLALRETLYRLFAAAADDKAPPPAELAAFNAALAQAPSRTRLAARADRYEWELAGGALGWPGALAPLLWSAADLLAGPREAPLRLCANPACRWVFRDASKGGRRRWCAMSACGNRAKAQRHYHRRKAAELS